MYRRYFDQKKILKILEEKTLIEQLIMPIAQTLILGENRTHDLQHSSQDHYPLEQLKSPKYFLTLRLWLITPHLRNT